MKNLSFVLIVMLFGCASQDPLEEENKIDGIFVDSVVDLVFKSETGEDLLDPTSEDAYSFEDMNLYYVVDGKSRQCLDSNMDYPESMKIDTNADGVLVLVIFTNVNSDEGTIIKQNSDSTVFTCDAILELNPNEFDTITTQSVQYNTGSVYVHTVSYNGVEIDRAEGDGSYVIEK